MQKFKQLLTGIDMTQGAPWKNILLFTLPLLIGNVFQQMYSTADAIILGRFVGDNALAAVGSSIPLFFFLMVIMIGISMGAGVMVAQYFGAKQREDLSYTVGTSLTITTIIGVVLTIAGPFITRPILVLLETPPEILDDSVLYMNVLMWGILGLAYFNILSGILRGLGDAFSPLVYLAIASVLNVILNIILIPGLGLGVWGAAIGTVFAQGLTSVLCLRRLMQMRDVFDFKLKYLRPKKKYVNQVLKLGIPTAASQAIFSIGMMIVQPLANGFGPMFLAANVIVMRLDGFVMMPSFSFGNAITVYTGQNIGAGKLDRISKGVKQCSWMALGTITIIVAIIVLFGHHIAGIFTETEEVILLSMRMLRILAIGYIIFSINMIFWGTIRGAGDAMTPFWGSIFNTIVVRVPTAFLFVHLMGRPEALMFSLLAGWITNTIIGALAYRFGNWRTRGLVKQNKQEEGLVKSMDFFEAVEKRYSHKEGFLPDPVPLADLERIADAGLRAPNGMNRQMVHLVLLPDRAAIEPICKVQPTAGLETAPAAIAVLTDTSMTVPQPDPVNFEREDYSAVTENMLLAITALGYSGLWLDYPYMDAARQKEAVKVLGAPAHFHLWVVIPIGKPDGKGSRREKLPFSDRVSYGKFGMLNK